MDNLELHLYCCKQNLVSIHGSPLVISIALSFVVILTLTSAMAIVTIMGHLDLESGSWKLEAGSWKDTRHTTHPYGIYTYIFEISN